MFNVGFAEIAVIVIVGLLIFGPDRLPNAVKSLTAGMRAFRGAATDASRTLRDAAGLDDPGTQQTLAEIADLHPKRFVSSILDPDAAPPAKPKPAEPAAPPADRADFDPDAA